MSARRYRAFISYSHRDEPWARWLHRALESYRIPRKLVGERTAHGEVPRRLTPVFRDRDELSSAADLSGKVKEALSLSAALIVICSPSAAASKWVNEEIRVFRRLGRGDRIFALIVDGDPQAAGDQACFPGALLEAESGERVEPLAADARKWADGRRLAKLKLLSGVLGIPLDGLRRRDLQKRQRTWVTITIAVAAIAFMATLAVTSRIAAEKRRVLAQELVGFKLSDLSGKLRLPEDVDILGRLDDWTQAERAAIAANAGGSTSEAIAAALALRESGMEERRRGDLSGALDDFRRSWATLALHYQRESTDQKLLFELGQAEFWIGNALVHQGDFEQAALAMGIYADISRRLLRSQPENGDLVLEMAYALTNLGRVAGAREASNPERALQFIQAALEFNQIALVLDPQNEFYRTELEQSHADVADAQLAVCDLGGALHSHMESARLAREFHDDAPGDFRKTQRLAFTLGGLAEVQASIGLADMALDALDESAALLRDLAAEQPGNADLRHVLLERRFRSFRLLARLGRQSEARELSRPLLSDWRRFLAEVEAPDVRARVDYGKFLLAYSSFEYLNGWEAEAVEFLDQAIAELGAVLEAAPDLRSAHDTLSVAAYMRWKYRSQPLPGELMAWVPGTGPDLDSVLSCEDSKLGAYLAVMRRDLQAAESYTAYLLDKGYFEPGFIRFCREEDLCREP